MNHIDILSQGRKAWNDWMRINWKDLPKFEVVSDRTLRNQQVTNLSLGVADLCSLDLQKFKVFEGYNFKRVRFNKSNLNKVKFINCQFKKANFSGADLSNTTFQNCSFELTNMLNANLSVGHFENCNFLGANLVATSLYKAIFKNCMLHNCNLMWAQIIETTFFDSSFYRCRLYAASIWNVNIENTSQTEFIITKREEIEISVDHLEIAQFLYLMINNSKIKNIIETLTSKIILILGRFTDERKPILNDIKDRIRTIGYIPVIFDFAKPEGKDYMEPVLLIAQLARFVIADFSDPKIILEEIPRIVDNTSTVIIPIITLGQREPSTLYNMRINRLTILDTYHYSELEELLSTLVDTLLPKAEERLRELQERRNRF